MNPIQKRAPRNERLVLNTKFLFHYFIGFLLIRCAEGKRRTFLLRFFFLLPSVAAEGAVLIEARIHDAFCRHREALTVHGETVLDTRHDMVGRNIIAIEREISEVLRLAAARILLDRHADLVRREDAVSADRGIREAERFFACEVQVLDRTVLHESATRSGGVDACIVRLALSVRAVDGDLLRASACEIIDTDVVRGNREIGRAAFAIDQRVDFYLLRRECDLPALGRELRAALLARIEIMRLRLARDKTACRARARGRPSRRIHIHAVQLADRRMIRDADVFLRRHLDGASGNLRIRPLHRNAAACVRSERASGLSRMEDHITAACKTRIARRMNLRHIERRAGFRGQSIRTCTFQRHGAAA